MNNFSRLIYSAFVPAEFISVNGVSKIGEVRTTHERLIRLFGPEHILELGESMELVEWRLKFCDGYDFEHCEPVTIYISHRDLPFDVDFINLLQDVNFNFNVGGYFDSKNKEKILSELRSLV